ncbi:MAG TPA: hypothetical protein DDW52_22695 [Planctomycetaceae bacterium]|nr:hypothetical protein [Planctomycetaceae bacterium]
MSQVADPKPNQPYRTKIKREIDRVFSQVEGLFSARKPTADEVELDRPLDDSLASPEQISTSENLELGSLQHRNQLPALLDNLGKNKLGIELGVAVGIYSDAILSGGNLQKLFSVDRWSDHHDDAECAEAAQLLSRHGIRSSILRMTFDEAAELFADNAFDFIYLDGYAHTGQGGVDTLELWWNKLKCGGIFAGHDYHPKWQPTIDVVDNFVGRKGLSLNLTAEDPDLEPHAYPSWYIQKPTD